MTEKIFRSILLASMAALLLCVILILGVLYSHFNDQLAEEMQNELAFIASGIEASGEEYLAGVSSQNQIVWLAPNGSVLYSSGEVGDISQNAEVRSAFESGFGQHEYAVSFTQRSLACAQRLSGRICYPPLQPAVSRLDLSTEYAAAADHYYCRNLCTFPMFGLCTFQKNHAPDFGH